MLILLHSVRIYDCNVSGSETSDYSIVIKLTVVLGVIKHITNRFCWFSFYFRIILLYPSSRIGGEFIYYFYNFYLYTQAHNYWYMAVTSFTQSPPLPSTSGFILARRRGNGLRGALIYKYIGIIHYLSPTEVIKFRLNRPLIKHLSNFCRHNEAKTIFL